jgi:hypothetical protein
VVRADAAEAVRRHCLAVEVDLEVMRRMLPPAEGKAGAADRWYPPCSSGRVSSSWRRARVQERAATLADRIVEADVITQAPGPTAV